MNEYIPLKINLSFCQKVNSLSKIAPKHIHQNKLLPLKYPKPKGPPLIIHTYTKTLREKFCFHTYHTQTDTFHRIKGKKKQARHSEDGAINFYISITQA